MMGYNNQVIRILESARELYPAQLKVPNPKDPNEPQVITRVSVTTAEQVRELSRIFGEDWHDLYNNIYTDSSAESNHNQLLIGYDESPVSMLQIIQSMARLQSDCNHERLLLAVELTSSNHFKGRIASALQEKSDLSTLSHQTIDSTCQLFENEIINTIKNSLNNLKKSDVDRNIYINSQSNALLHGVSNAHLCALAKVIIDQWYRTLTFDGTNPATQILTQACINRFNSPFPHEDDDPTQSDEAMDLALLNAESNSDALKRMIRYNYAAARLYFIMNHTQMMDGLLTEVQFKTIDQLRTLHHIIAALNKQIQRMNDKIDEELNKPNNKVNLEKIDTLIARMNNLALTAKKLIDMTPGLLLNKPDQHLKDNVTLALNDCLNVDRDLRGTNPLSKSKVDLMLREQMNRLEPSSTSASSSAFGRFRNRMTNSNSSSSSSSSSNSDGPDMKNI